MLPIHDDLSKILTKNGQLFGNRNETVSGRIFSTATTVKLSFSLRVLGKKLFNLNIVKRHLIQVAQPVGRVKFTWGSQLTGSEALWEFLV